MNNLTLFVIWVSSPYFASTKKEKWSVNLLPTKFSFRGTYRLIDKKSHLLYHLQASLETVFINRNIFFCSFIDKTIFLHQATHKSPWQPIFFLFCLNTTWIKCKCTKFNYIEMTRECRMHHTTYIKKMQCGGYTVIFRKLVLICHCRSRGCLFSQNRHYKSRAL